ncbi:nuclear transport factor 2 family protein [Shewanella sp. OMA3-2]|uniref:nuclear transport factor 2 family protein n=1 Tax=Shewanella sp. OMA3-2 TaxID=2908650 RepID=UPI001F475D3C|nr:nuclear transport factor 2 family protein [Shewanella sp. OMA3-2]UJF22795.1 nuclear transport factor 2 family protein [Shewanella sp. OMA3-2]
MTKIAFVLLTFLSMTSVADDLILTDKMKALDTALFESFNRCQNPDELVKHASFFATDVEFYHDNGGVTWDRDSMIANTKNNACGHYSRKLIDGTFNVHSIKDFGAITKGVHIFCQNKTNECEGKADFVMVWRQVDDKWQITRVLSYGHRKNK